MLHIKFEYRDEISYPEWQEQECIGRSVKECRGLYGVGVDWEYRRISSEAVK